MSIWKRRHLLNLHLKKPINNHTTEEQHDGKEEEVNLEGVIGWVFQH